MRALALLLCAMATISATLPSGAPDAAAQDCDLVDEFGDCVEECDFGEYEHDGKCVSECPDGYVPDEISDTCEPDSSSPTGSPTPSQYKVTIDGIPAVREGETFSVSGVVQDRSSGAGLAGVSYTISLNLDGREVTSQSGNTLGDGTFSREFVAPDVDGKEEFLVLAIVPGGSDSELVTVQDRPFGCLIATAAFGSELAPQVQFLRDFRDNRILATASGASFMGVFNAWYYSFSPYVAEYERQQPWLQQAVRVAIYPLLGILSVSEKAYSVMPSETGSVAAGLVASSLLGIVYASPIALSIKRLRKHRLDLRLALGGIGTLAALVLAAALAGSGHALVVTTPLLVLATLATSAMASASVICRLAGALKRHPNNFSAPSQSTQHL